MTKRIIGGDYFVSGDEVIYFLKNLFLYIYIARLHAFFINHINKVQACAISADMILIQIRFNPSCTIIVNMILIYWNAKF